MRSHISGIQIPTDARLNIDGGLTLDAQAGTSGHMLISQGANVTPIWSNTLTSPTINTSLVAGSASFDLLTTVATTINFGSAATTMNIATNNVTKTINLGTGGSGGNGVDINIGTSQPATSSNINLYGQTILGKPVTSATTATGYIVTLTNQGTGNSATSGGSATGGHLYISAGGAGVIDEFNGTGTATGGNLYLNSGYAVTFGGTATKGQVLLGTLTDTGSVTIGRTAITTTIAGPLALSGTVGGYTMTGTLVGATTSTSIAPIRLPSGTVPSTANQQFGMVATAAESIQLSTTKTTGAGPGFGFIRAPQMVYAVANSSAATSTTPVSPFAAANDVLSSLEVGKAYRFRGTYYLSTTFTSGTATIQLAFAFSNAPVIFKYNYKTYNQNGNNSTFEKAALTSSNASTTISAASTFSTDRVVEFEGFFTSNATTASTLTPQLLMSTTGSSTVATAGSFFEIEKLGTSSQTLIAGNWA